ncbi:MAG: methyltransferase domain-containing protein [Proteobacteria bacterium]|nr:methyltransferase domain-containing protein [Pseudomonadota bacterium]
MTRPDDGGYDRLYKEFDSPLSKKMRAAAYARDIGQHSWVSAEELEAVIPQLGLNAASLVLDLGCGPGGPLTFLAGETGCRGNGVDLSAPAIAAARERAIALGLQTQLNFQQGDLHERLPFSAGTFDAALSLDVILHVRDRETLFGEIARVLKPRGRFFFTDAGVLTGTVTAEERRLRASTAPLQFVAPGFNERALESAAFRVIACRDSTENVLAVAKGRLSARALCGDEFKAGEGETEFCKQELYLKTVAALSERRALSRISYLVETDRNEMTA